MARAKKPERLPIVLDARVTPRGRPHLGQGTVFYYNPDSKWARVRWDDGVAGVALFMHANELDVVPNDE